MATFALIPDSTYSAGTGATAPFTMPAGQTSARVTVAVFTMGNDGDSLTINTEDSDDGATWVHRGAMQFIHMVHSGGTGPYFTQFQTYYGVRAFVRLTWAIVGSGRYSANLDAPAPNI